MQIQINWIELIKTNEEKIMEAGRQAYRNACGSTGDREYTEDAKITMFGEVEQYANHQDYSPKDVWLGQADAIFSFRRFNPWDFEQEEEKVIFAFLDEAEAEAFQQYIKQQNIDRMTKGDLENWSKEIYEKVHNKYIQYFISNNIEEQVQQQYDKYLETLMKPCSIS